MNWIDRVIIRICAALSNPGRVVRCEDCGRATMTTAAVNAALTGDDRYVCRRAGCAGGRE